MPTVQIALPDQLAEQIGALPKLQQKFVIQVLESVLAQQGR